MRFFALLAQGSHSARVRILVYMSMSAIGMAVMAIVMTSVADGGFDTAVHYELLFVFILAAVVVVSFNKLSQYLIIDICEDVLGRLRVRMAGYVRGADLDKLERIGQTPIYDSIARNTTLVSESAAFIVAAVTSGASLILAVLYLVVWSWLAFWVVVSLLLAVGYAYIFAGRRSRPAFIVARAAETRFFALLGHLLWGFKEVKLSSQRGDDLESGFIGPQSRQVEELKIVAGQEFGKGIMASMAVFYFMLGTVAFILPQYMPSTAIAVKVLSLSIFAWTCLEFSLRGVPLLQKVDVALEQLEDLERELAAAGPGQETPATDATATTLNRMHRNRV